MPLFSSLAGIAEARVKHTARRLTRRAALLAVCVLLGLIAAGFAIAAGVVALADAVGTVPALLIFAGCALLLLLVALAVLASDARAGRRVAVRRQTLDGEFARAAMLSAASTRPSRGVVGLALVAVGSLLVLARRR